MNPTKLSRWLMIGTIVLALGAVIVSYVVPNIPGKTTITGTPNASSSWPTAPATTTPHISPQDLIIKGSAAADLKDIVPTPNSVIKSPLTITGSAHGTMFFEATFPIVLVDDNGKTVAQGQGRATSDWMTTDFVPFTATLTWSEVPTTDGGMIIFKRDNPSGLPENDREASMTVRFRGETSQPLEGDTD